MTNFDLLQIDRKRRSEYREIELRKYMRRNILITMIVAILVIGVALLLTACASTHVAPPIPTATEQTPDSSYGKTVYNSGVLGRFIGRDGKTYNGFSIEFHEAHPSLPGVWSVIIYQGHSVKAWCATDDQLVAWYAGEL